MTERRSGTRKSAANLEKRTMKMKNPMTKLQKQVTEWMKANVPTKKTKFLHSHIVDYFIGSKAVDLLMYESPWTKTKDTPENQELVFESRDQCVEFLDTLLRYKMFHRAKKIPVAEKAPKPDWKLRVQKKFPQKEDESGSKKEDAESKKESEENNEEEKEENEQKPEKEKKKRRIRLDMHLDQIFADNTDAYVWLYDPIPWYYWLAGAVIVAIAVTFVLFPLWPKRLRRYAYYLSMASVVFIGGVVCTAVLKYLIFGVLYILSNFKLRFWIMPNLTEDVGFIKSFWPLYKYTYTGEVIKDKDSDDEEEDSREESEDEHRRKVVDNVTDFEIADSDNQIMSRNV